MAPRSPIKLTPEIIQTYRRCKEINAGSPRRDDEIVETALSYFNCPFNRLDKLLGHAPWEFTVFDFPENDPSDLGNWAGVKALRDALEEALKEGCK